MVAVSIILPVYDAEDFLSDALESLLSQTLDDIEIVAVNDGSTDRSADVLNSYATADARVRVLTRANGGLSAARNTGIAAAWGKYLMFVDSDDRLRPGACEELVSVAERDGLDLLFYSGTAFYDPPSLVEEYPSYAAYYDYKESHDEVRPGLELFSELRRSEDFKPSACLQFYRREFLIDNGLAFFPGILHEDNLWTVECLLRAERAAVLDRKFYERRVRRDSIVTRAKTWENARGRLVAIREIMGEVGRVKSLEPASARALADYCVAMAMVAGREMFELADGVVDQALETLPQGEVDLVLTAQMVRRVGELQGWKTKHYRELTELRASSKEMVNLRAAAGELRKSVSESRATIASLENTVASLENTVNSLQNSVDSLRGDVASKDRELAAVYSSLSLKLGRALTLPLRKGLQAWKRARR